MSASNDKAVRDANAALRRWAASNETAARTLADVARKLHAAQRLAGGRQSLVRRPANARGSMFFGAGAAAIAHGRFGVHAGAVLDAAMAEGMVRPRSKHDLAALLASVRPVRR